MVAFVGRAMASAARAVPHLVAVAAMFAVMAAEALQAGCGCAASICCGGLTA